MEPYSVEEVEATTILTLTDKTVTMCELKLARESNVGANAQQSLHEVL